MAFDSVDTNIKIPYDELAILSNDPVKLAAYLLELAETIQRLLEELANATNFAISLTDGDAIYSKLKQANGSYPIGTWRLKQVDDNWERQVQLTVGTWTFAGDFERPE